MRLHEVGRKAGEVLDQTVANLVLVVELNKVTLLKPALLRGVSAAHDSDGAVASHLGQREGVRLAARSAHLEDLAQLGHHERLDVAHVEALLAVGVHAAEERGGLERATIHGDTRLLAAEHLT